MNHKRNELLLAAARILIVLFKIFLIIGLVGLCLGVTVLLTVASDEVTRRVVAADAPAYSYWLVISAFALIGVAIALAIRFFERLYDIVVSVDAGDPFTPVNAERLRAMGWLSLAGQLVFLPVAAIGEFLTPYLARLGETYQADFGIDPGGVLLVLLLFILASVFERGSELRDDLEGTV